MEPAPPDKVLVYDGDCTLCQAASRRIVRAAGLPEAARASHLSFEGETAQRLEASGIRNEMAVIAPATGEIRSGLAGILWFLRGTRWNGVAWALDRRTALVLLTPLYRLIAYNRRVIAPPPPRAFACACDPDPYPRYNVAFTGGLAVVGALGGSGVARFASLAAGLSSERAWQLCGLAAALVLSGVIVAARSSPPGRRRAAHTAWILALATGPSVLLLPLAYAYPSVSRLPPWFLVGPAVGLLLGARALRRRSPRLRANARRGPRSRGA